MDCIPAEESATRWTEVASRRKVMLSHPSRKRRGLDGAQFIKGESRVRNLTGPPALVSCWSCMMQMKPSYDGLMRIETEAYTNQGYLEQAPHVKGQIYDPSPSGAAGRDHRINSAARGSVNSSNECGSGPIGERDSKCSK